MTTLTVAQQRAYERICDASSGRMLVIAMDQRASMRRSTVRGLSIRRSLTEGVCKPHWRHAPIAVAARKAKGRPELFADDERGKVSCEARCASRNFATKQPKKSPAKLPRGWLDRGRCVSGARLRHP